MQPERAEQVLAQAARKGHAQPLGDGGDDDVEVVIMANANGHTGEPDQRPVPYTTARNCFHRSSETSLVLYVACKFGMFSSSAEDAEPQETLMEFKVEQSEECPVCIHEFSQDVSAGQVTLLLYMPARCLQPGSPFLLLFPSPLSTKELPLHLCE